MTRIQNESVFEKRPQLKSFLLVGGIGHWHYCRLAMYGQVTEVLGVIQSVPDQELVRCVESDELRVGYCRCSAMCLCSSAQISSERGFRARKKIHQPVQRPAGIDDVLDEQDVLALELGFRIIHQPDVPARHRRVAVARGDEEIDLQRPPDLAHEVAQKDKASLQQPEHQQLAVRIARRDLLARARAPAPRSAPRRTRCA